jgi:hypothetical protein
VSQGRLALPVIAALGAAMLLAPASAPLGPASAYAQFGGKVNCPAGQKRSTLIVRKDQKGKILKVWCIGVNDKRRANPGHGEAFIATEWITGNTSVWIHKCGLPNGQNKTEDKADISKRVKSVNSTPDGQSTVEYDFDAEAGVLKITTRRGGTVVDTKELTGADLPHGPSRIPHPGEDLMFGTDDDVDPVGEGCSFDRSAFFHEHP